MNKKIKHKCYKCLKSFDGVTGIVKHEPLVFCTKCFKEVYPKINTGIFLTKDETNTLSSLHFRCISPSYNFMTLSVSDPNEKYNKFMDEVKAKYNIDYDFEISKDGEIIYQIMEYPKKYIPKL